MEHIDITIVGAGVIGLAIGFELSKTGKNTIILEKNPSFGQETSSRNSEVIHAGIYYPKESLKARMCVEGNPLLFDFCSRYNVPHKKIGKLIVALAENELKELEALYKNGIESGARGLTLISGDTLKKYEPNVHAVGAVYSAETGIIDSHGFMKTLESFFKQSHGMIVYHTALKQIEKRSGGFDLVVQDKEEFKFTSRVVINAAGLYADKVASMAGIKEDAYRLKYCKGDYFRVHNNKGKAITRLIYPVPKKDRAGLGIHATLDLAGSLRLGPDDEYVKEISYTVDASKKGLFYEASCSFLPFIALEDLSPDTSGIRPKLQGPGESFRDFIIKEERENDCPGFINLIGIESPGLTASLSIAKRVAGMVEAL